MDHQYDDYDDVGLLDRVDAEVRKERLALGVVTFGPIVAMCALLLLSHLLGK